MKRDFIWAEKYRPSTIRDTILPKNLKATFQAIVDSGEVMNMIFAGTAGLGKTTVARAICEELDLDYIVINGSTDGNIDTLRDRIKQFASTVSMSGGYKVVILDEADGLNPNSFQPGLRAFMEEFSKNCRFILTCNFKDKIIEPLHSRCSMFSFNTSKKDLAPLSAQMMARIEFILKTEGVEYDKKTLASLIMKYGPDWRKTIGEIQRISMSNGMIESNVLHRLGTDEIDELVNYLKKKEFTNCAKWVKANLDTDSAAIFKSIYDKSWEHAKPATIPNLILTLGEYQYKAAFAADQEINTMACLTEIMSEVEWK
jgi:DNA polymerase III delta prime subunit